MGHSSWGNGSTFQKPPTRRKLVAFFVLRRLHPPEQPRITFLRCQFQNISQRRFRDKMADITTISSSAQFADILKKSAVVVVDCECLQKLPRASTLKSARNRPSERAYREDADRVFFSTCLGLACPKYAFHLNQSCADFLLLCLLTQSLYSLL